MYLMAKKDHESSATKQDIGLLMERMGEIYDANERWKQEIIHEFHLKKHTGLVA